MSRQPLHTLAHAAGTVNDLPLDVPLWLLLAAAAVVGTAGGLSRRDAQHQHPPARRPWPSSRRVGALAVHPAVRGAGRGAGLLALAFVLALVLAGPSGADRSPLTRGLLVLAWGGLVPASLVLGPFYRHVNPLRPLAAALGRWLGTGPQPLPPRLGRLPAAGFAVVLVALSQFGLDALTAVRIGVLLFVGLQLLMGARYGPRWFPRGDPFEVLSDVVGAVAITGPGRDGRLGLRDPVIGATEGVPLPGTRAFAGVLVGAAWTESLADAVALDDLALALVAGLVGAVVGTGLLRAGALRDFLVPATLPLAAAYGLQLYVVPLLLDGRIALSQLSDPFGWNAPLPALVARGVQLPVSEVVVAGGLWIAFVALHVLSIVIAHRASLARFDLRGARAVQFPMRAVVLASVVLGLWLPTLGP